MYLFNRIFGSSTINAIFVFTYMLKLSDLHIRATTHTDMVLRAREKGIEVKAIHNASIMNAVGCCGLQVRVYNSLINFHHSSHIRQFLSHPNLSDPSC